MLGRVENTNMTDCITSLQNSDKHLPQSPFTGQFFYMTTFSFCVYVKLIIPWPDGAGPCLNVSSPTLLDSTERRREFFFLIFFPSVAESGAAAATPPNISAFSCESLTINNISK
jgi:hypothetical protein